MADRSLHKATPNTSTDSLVSRVKHAARALRLPIVVACLTAGAFIIGTNWRSSDAADPPQDKNAPDAKYAQVFLDLAEAQLAYAEQMNRASAGTFSKEQLSQYRQSVALWQKLLKQESISGEFDRMTALVQLANARLLQARIEVANAKAINRDVPGTISPERLKELQAYVALAQLDAHAGEQAEAADPTARLHWRVAVLEDELLLLRKEVARNRRTQQ